MVKRQFPNNPSLLDLQNVNILRDICGGKKTGQEENIKIKIVLKVLDHLGWPLVDMDFEHHVRNKRADIALMVGNKPKVIVETKSLEVTNLGAHKSQALEYAIVEGADWSILTNGNEFQLYRTYISGVPTVKNRPVFQIRLNNLFAGFEEFKSLVGHKEISQIDKKTRHTIDVIRDAVTEEDLIETLREGKRILFFELLGQFDVKYGTDKGFREKIDTWVKDNQINKEINWLNLYKKSKTFRYQVNGYLGLTKNIDKDWINQYQYDRLFRNENDKKLRENDVLIDWIDRLCAEGSLTFINRILLLRICEDRGIIRKTITPEWLAFLRSAHKEESVKSAIDELFDEISQKFNIYSKPIFDHVMLNELNWPKEKVSAVVEMSTKYNFAEINRDLIGNVYQKHIPREMRRALGQFYTPEDIVKHIIDQLNFTEDFTVIDPACGSGGFLLTAYESLKKKLLESGKTENEAHKKIISELIYGIDIDPFAIQLTHMNLILKNVAEPTDITNVVEGDSIPMGLTSPLETNKKFNAVLSNPPYFNVSLNDERYKEYFENYYSPVINGLTNISSLFLKRGIDMLKVGGHIGIVLPKSFLRVNSYDKIRKYLLDKCIVKSISDIGLGFEDVGYEVVTIVAERRDPQKNAEDDNLVSIITDIKDLSNRSYSLKNIEQSFFKETGSFLIYLTGTAKDIYELMKGEHFIALGGEKGISNIWRGLPFSRKSDSISKNKTSNYNAKCLAGESIGRLTTNDVYWLKQPADSEAVNKLRTTKIVVQNIVTSKVRCVATFDPVGDLDIDTVTNVKVTDKRFEEKYVLGIMVSKLMSWYLRDVIFNRATLTMHMDDDYLGQLPIKIADQHIQNEIIITVDKLLNLYSKPMPANNLLTYAEHKLYVDKSEELNRELNEKVFNLYGLSQQQKEYVEAMINYD